MTFLPNGSEMTAVLVAISITALTTHCWTFGGGIKCLLRFKLRDEEREESKDRVQAAFEDACVKHYLQIARYWSHAAAGIAGGLVLQFVWTAPSPFDHVLCLTVIIGWAFHYISCTGLVQLSLNHVRLLYLLFNVMQLVWQPSLSYMDAVTLTAARVGGRFAVALCLMDIKMTIPVQVLFSIAEMRGAWHLDGSSFYGMVLVQITQALIIMVGVCLFEFPTRSRLAMLIDSESMVSSFRRMLRGVCDGELILDENLQIIGNTDSLTRLLMSRKISGDFEQLLIEGDRGRFRHFVANVNQNSAQPTPPCLRLSLQLDEVRVAVDLFHVRVSPLLGEALHLLAFREDAESRLRQEARAARHEVPRMLLPSPQRARTAGSARSCASDVSALLQICHELQEMTLLVDSSTAMLDVEQAHMSFSRDSAEDSMPSLRRIVQPTDWPSVRDLLVDFSRSQSELPASERTVLRTKLRLREGKRCIAARRVEVSTYSSPLKLHLHLSRMRVETQAKHEGALPELYEHSESDLSG